MFQQCISSCKSMINFINKRRPHQIQWNNKGRSPIKSLEWGHTCRRVISSIIPQLSPRKKCTPLAWLLIDETTQILFHTMVDNFKLAIHLRMVGRTHLELCTQHFKKFLPELTDENGVPITDNRLRHSM